MVDSNEPVQTTLRSAGNVRALPKDAAIARAAPIRLQDESDADYGARKAELQARIGAAYDGAEPKADQNKISTDPTPAFTSADADRALAHYNETGLSPAVQADLRKNGLSPVSRVEKDAARQFLEGVRRDPAKLKAFAEGTDLVLNGKISSASLLLASPLGNFSEAELQSRMRAIAALKG